MIRNEATVLLASPPARVFEHLADADKLKGWVGGLVESRLAEPGPLRAGSAYRQVLLLDGKRETVERRLTEYDPPTVLAFRVRLANLEMEGQFDLEEEGSGTRLTFVQQTTPHGLAVLAASLIERRIGDKIRADLDALKRVLERPAA